MLDEDHFKRINDRLGHAAGDAAPLHLVALLQNSTRGLDRPHRLGGEEFCLLLPQGLQWQGEPLGLTAIFGVVSCRPGDPQGDSMLAMADWLVYWAKSAGRDRICVAEPDMALGRRVRPA